MTELEKAFNGEAFNQRDQEIQEHQNKVKNMCYEYNNLRPDDEERKKEILKDLVTGYNDYLFIEPNFRCVFGKNIHFKGMAILNFDCTLLDTNIITIGDRTLIGPNDSEERLQGVFNNKPITIGARVWIGANVTICPGVTIGDNAVIGAGSVVTKDIPANVVAVGNPCKVLRKIIEADKINSL